MDASPSFKIVHLVRHGQGIHNVVGEKDHAALLSPALFDAHLSSLGWQQADQLREYIHACGLYKRIELVITSPLLRAMQTASGVFGGESPAGGVSLTPIMVADAGNSGRSEVSSHNCPPFMAVELCRERLGVHPCDKRRRIAECRSLFPAIDFSLIKSEEDTWWKADIREDDESIAARGKEFMNWLRTRKEKEIAVVTHDRFLQHTLDTLVDDSDPSMKSKLCKRFGNCELRSFVVVDKGSTYVLREFKIPVRSA